MKLRRREEKRYSKMSIVFIELILFVIVNVSGNNQKKAGLIYILEWTPRVVEPFNFLEQEQNAFVIRKCAFQNCFLTSNHHYFDDVLDFDAIIFNAVHMYYEMALPPKRSQSQKYIMVAMEPAGYFPIPDSYDGFFNLTWTYKLDSDVPFPYIVVTNQFNEEIGPKTDMHWMDISQMNETSVYVQNKLQNKRIAAAWIASNCESIDRLDFVHDLRKELAKYEHSIDAYGNCGDYNCPRKEGMDECFALIESDYYFYLAFENSYGQDYVSEKLLHALEHYAIPVVLGGANYSRFMPKGIYLDAKRLGPERLAKRMTEIIKDQEAYHKFFKWHGYYSFHFTGEDQFFREICGLCELLNNKTRMKQISIWDNIVEWWNEPRPATRAPWHLILDDKEVGETGVQGFVLKLYNYVFGS